MVQKRGLSSLYTFLFLAFVFGLLLFLSLNRHSRAEKGTYHSEIWGDKAGYNAYLPALFIYGFDESRFPADIEAQTGNGFRLDTVNHVVYTKYPYGVSLMQAPFWLGAHLLASEKTGYSTPYYKCIHVAAAFYTTLGLYFLFLFLASFGNRRNAFIVSAAVLLGTNLFHYAIFDNGMSHIYSFCCLSALLYMGKKHPYGQPWPVSTYLVYGLLLGLIIAIRNINLLFVPFLLLTDLDSAQEIWAKIKRLFLSPGSLALYAVMALFLAPLLLYSSYTQQVYAYTGEGFTYWRSPKIAQVLFAPQNGLFLYSPILLLGLYPGLRQKIGFPVYMVYAVFVLLTLTYASWWSPYLGCGFGHRGFTEFAGFLFVPLVLRHRTQNLSLGICILLFLLCLYSLKLLFSYDLCFFGTSEWDFSEFLRYLTGNFK